MKLSLSETVGKRPFSLSFWLILLAAPSFIVITGVTMLLWQSQLGQVAWLLVKVTFHLIPPFIWLGGGTIVVFWLLVLRRLWQQGD
ncbi:MAG: hypothetical protein WAS33_10010 [Candidatus Promineifilaceae bacterium]